MTAVERFHKSIWGHHFILQTDPRSLLALFNSTNTKGLNERTSARHKRWALRLIGFDFEIEYVKTDDFGQADALSSLIVQARVEFPKAEISQVIAAAHVGQELGEITTTSRMMQNLTKRYPILEKIIDC